MKSLNIIQTLSKIGKVLSKIAFIFSIVGFFGCIAGLVSMCFENGDLIRIGGVTLHTLIPEKSGYNIESISSICVMLSGWIPVCAGEAVVAKFAETYFKHELQTKTPFTSAGASELKRLGILTIAVSAGCSAIGTMVQELAAGFTGAAWTENVYDCESAVVIGIMFIVMSVFCNYGAEIIESEKM